MHVLVALSGGADSVALLLLLDEARDRLHLRLSAAHFEHGIRGGDSLQDAAFVKALCDACGVRLLAGSADVPALARAGRRGLEEAARDARRAFLREAMDQAGADAIVTAHHMDDQAETLLMHALRGCGIGALAGMRGRDKCLGAPLIRPLLSVTKRELIEYLAGRGQVFCRDATNEINDQPRNFLRNRVMPLIREVYPGAVRALDRLSRTAAREDDLVQGLARDWLERHTLAYPGGMRVDARNLPHEALLWRALAQVALCCGLHPDYALVERLVRLCGDGSGAVSTCHGLTARAFDRYIYVEATGASSGARASDISVPLSPEAAAVLPGLGEIRLTQTQGEAGAFSQRLDMDKLKGAVLRTRRAGDYIRPLGMTGSMSLGKYLIGRGVHRPVRSLLPLVAVGNEVLWAVGVGISSTAAITPHTAHAVTLTYRGAALWPPDATQPII